MELILDLGRYAVTAFFGLIGSLFVLVLLFGKRIHKKWDYEAKFRDAAGREIGEFDIELSRIEKEDSDYTLHAKFVLKHPALERAQTVRVYLEDTLVMQGLVELEGRIRFGVPDLVGELKSPEAGQICLVRCGEADLFAEPLRRD
jgi:hypothetical protein